MYIKNKIRKKTKSNILRNVYKNTCTTQIICKIRKDNIPHALEGLNPYAIYVFQFGPVTVLIQLIDYNDEVVHDVMMKVIDHRDQHLNIPNDFVAEVDFVLHDEMVVESKVAENLIE